MVPASESKRGAVIDHDICDRGFAAVSAGSAWWQRTCRAPTPHTDCEAPLPALYFQSEQHATHAARHHRHSPGFHLSPTRKDLVSSDNNCLTTLGFRLNGYGAQPCGLRPASFRLGFHFRPLSSYRSLRPIEPRLPRRQSAAAHFRRVRQINLVADRLGPGAVHWGQLVRG
jgi:hypothetical protein